MKTPTAADAPVSALTSPNPPEPTSTLIETVTPLVQPPRPRITPSVFKTYRDTAYPFRYSGTLEIDIVMGGTPSEENVAKGFIQTKLGITNEEKLQEKVAELMAERGITEAAAVDLAVEARYLNGFKKDPVEGLYLEGRHLKAAIKEASNIAWENGRWARLPSGKVRYVNKSAVEEGTRVSGKATRSFFAERTFIVENELFLRRPVLDDEGNPTGETTPILTPDGIAQRFVQTFRGSSMQYEEFVKGCWINFHLISDVDISHERWGMLWNKGEMNGIGATRSQSYGRYRVIRWEQETSD